LGGQENLLEKEFKTGQGEEREKIEKLVKNPKN
jgi:hypothetical protein